MTSQLATKISGDQGKSRVAAKIILVALAYFATGRLGLAIPYLDSHITLIWLPAGIAVAALLRWGYVCWPGIFLGALATNFSIDSSPLLDGCIALGNTLAPLLAASLLRRFEFRGALDRAYDILLLVVAAAIGMLVSASGGVGSLVLFKVLPVQHAGAAWLSWWAGDFVGVLLAAPLLLNISRAELKKLSAQRLEFLAWCSIMLAVSWHVFLFINVDSSHSEQLVFMLLPSIVWSAMRFGVMGSSFGVLLPAVIASVATSLGLGPFYTADEREGLSLLLLFFATLVLVDLMVAAMQAARKRAAEIARLDSDLSKELIQSLPGIFYMLDTSGRFLMWNRNLESVLQCDSKEIARSHMLDFFEGSDRSLIDDNVRKVFEIGDTEVEAVLVAKNGARMNYRFTGHRIERNGEHVLVGVGLDLSERIRIQRETDKLLRRHQALMKAATEGIHIMDIQGNVVEANDAFCRMLGYSQEEVAGLSVFDWDAQLSREELQERFRKLVGSSALVETVHRRKDGTLINVEISSTGVEIEGVPYIVSLSRDITERMRIQKETETLLRRYQTLMGTALDGFRVMDIEGNVVEANDAFCRMLGYTHEEALKLNIADWDAQWTKEELLQRLKGFVGKSGATFETVQRRKDGTLVDVEVSTTGVEIDGQPYFFASSRDISERKRIERRNEVLMRRHRAVMNSALEGIHIMDEQGNIVEANDTYCRMLGYSQEEMARLNVADWDVLCASKEELMERFNKLIRSDGALFESRQRRKDGTVIDVEISAAGVELDGHRYLYASSHDITARKANEKLLEEARLRESNALHELHVTFDTSGEGFWKADRSGHIVEANDAYCGMIGYPRSEVVGAHISRFEALEPTPEMVDEHIQLIMRKGLDRFETKHRHRDGHLIDLELVVSYVKRTDSMIVFMRDVTERKQIGELLRIAAITFDTQEGIMITDADAKILRVNQAFHDITGYDAAEVIGRNPSMFQSGHHDAAFYRAMWTDLLSTGKWAGEVWDKRKNGEIYPKLLTITAAYDDKKQVTHYVAVFRDISNRKKSEQEIHQLAFYDPLTKLPNRRLLLDRLQQALAVSARNGRYGALLFLDMDHFKTINDTQGHAKGDLLLVEVARRLQTCVRGGDSVARLGGDEFVVVLEDLSSAMDEAATQTELVAEKIRAELDRPYVLQDYEFLSSVSIGISLFFEHKETAEDLLRHADVAMYQAKMAGRNAIRFFDPHMQMALEARAAMEADLRHALEKQQFHLSYQVQVDSLHRPLGAEVLLRWDHPDRGEVAPTQFIPLAEETGLIVPIGLWVLKTACAQLREWQNDARTRDLVLAVNVSAKQFRQPDFVDQAQRILLESGAKPSHLKMEFTESTVLENVEDTISKMRELKILGVGFSVDDFGTGYSSLQYLKRLPLDQIKIDQSFVRDIASDPNDAAIVQTIIAMTEALGLNVIAEGVETMAQFEFLDNHGCHAFQGYLFSKPVSIEEFERVLRGKLKVAKT
jgi:diguanylate cyclase (GGDEF)-like protein/PAS domain S-box-containing protein